MCELLKIRPFINNKALNNLKMTLKGCGEPFQNHMTAV
jgi:hypothetical protein